MWVPFLNRARASMIIVQRELVAETPILTKQVNNSFLSSYVYIFKWL